MGEWGYSQLIPGDPDVWVQDSWPAGGGQRGTAVRQSSTAVGHVLLALQDMWKDFQIKGVTATLGLRDG